MAAWPIIQENMRPTNVAEINTVIETLTQMYFEREREDEQYDLWLDAYTKALKHWPTDLLWLACRKWIADGKGHMPAPSDLKRCIERTYRERFSIYSRARIAVEWLEANPDERPFVETPKTKAMTKRLKQAITKAAKARLDDRTPAQDDMKEIVMHRGQPDADKIKIEVEEAKAKRRKEQARRADEFMRKHLAKNQPSNGDQS